MIEIDGDTSRATIHLYDVKLHGIGKFYAHCCCQWDSKPVRTYEEARKRGLAHVEAKRNEHITQERRSV